MNTKMMIERNETDKWNSRMESATPLSKNVCLRVAEIDLNILLTCTSHAGSG